MIALIIAACLYVGFIVMVASFMTLNEQREVAFRKAWLAEQRDAEIIPIKDKTK
jgi:hypothetical protein